MMLDKVKSFIGKMLNESETLTDLSNDIQLAAALLLVEVMNADDKIDERERNAVQTGLKNIFEMTDEKTRAVFEIAENRAKDVIPLQRYTSILNKALEPEAKLKLLEQIWRVVFSDDEMDKYEESLVREIAELLYIRHSDFIFARQRAKGEI
ncbi:MAG TPA: TerB family tellurite resistance protein [Gammaproteobacteria bacterium]|nr:TerB family tellurite resistance protein [Gammaproteobacteria bacterium]